MDAMVRTAARVDMLMYKQVLSTTAVDDIASMALAAPSSAFTTPQVAVLDCQALQPQRGSDRIFGHSIVSLSATIATQHQCALHSQWGTISNQLEAVSCLTGKTQS